MSIHFLLGSWYSFLYCYFTWHLSFLFCIMHLILIIITFKKKKRIFIGYLFILSKFADYKIKIMDLMCYFGSRSYLTILPLIFELFLPQLAPSLLQFQQKLLQLGFLQPIQPSIQVLQMLPSIQKPQFFHPHFTLQEALLYQGADHLLL